MSGEIVLNLQGMLYDLGYLEIEGGGEFGQLTYEAVVWFQNRNHIEPASGVADISTCRALLGEPVSAEYFVEQGEDDPGIIYGGTYIITSARENLALDVEGDSVFDGANVQLFDVTYSGAQKWVVQGAGNGYYRIRNLCSWKCLDLSGTDVVQSIYNDSWTQLWYFIQDEDGYYHIVDAGDMYLNVDIECETVRGNVDASYSGWQ